VTGSKLLTGSLSDSQIARLVIQVESTIGVTTDELAGLIGRPTALVAAWEAAESRPSDDDVSAMAAQCGVTGEALVLRVQAFAIDQAMGILHVGGSSAYVDPRQGNEHVLRTYVGLVRNMRMLPDDSPVELRSHDLDVLADYLDLDDDALVQQLVRVALVTQDEALELHRQLMRRPILASVAGLLAGGLATLGLAGHAVADRPLPPPIAAVVTTLAPPRSAIVTTTTALPPPPPPAIASSATVDPVTPAPAAAPVPAVAAPATTTAPSVSRHKTTRTTTTTVPAGASIGDPASVTNPDVPVQFSPPQP
jgi:hypothetical protein